MGDPGDLGHVDGATLRDFQSESGTMVTDVVGDEVGARVLAMVEDVLDTGRSGSMDFAVDRSGRTVHLRGDCAPCGDDEVIWITRDRTAEYTARLHTERRADLEALAGDAVQALVDVDGSDEEWAETTTEVMRRVAGYFGASTAYLRRFRGARRIEVVGSWRSGDVEYDPPGTSGAGGKYFPWASRELAREPVLVVPRLSELGPEAAVDVESLIEGGDVGFVWVRIGPPRRPAGLFGLTFDGPIPSDPADSYEPLIGLSATVLALAARRDEDARRNMQREIFESLVHGEPLETVLAQVCRLREIGAPGQRCVVWLPDGARRLRPTGSGAEPLDGVDPCPPESPECAAFVDGQRRSRSGSDDVQGALARVLGATAVDIVPLVSATDRPPVGVLSVYDTSRVPIDPASGVDGPHTRVAASLAIVAIERVTDLSELAHRATHDSLTGLANREAFIGELERAIVASGPVDRLVAVLYCDVDRFKELNDRLGHRHGDRFLGDVSARIAAAVPPEAIVARLGGDEFGVLLTGLGDENDALAVAERIRRSMHAASAGTEGRSTVSIGVAVSGSPTEHAEGLLRDADVAMYRAKSTGRDRVEMFAEHIRREARARDRLGRDLAEALASGEVTVHYQPMVDLTSGRLMGFEALARWQHHARGFVTPTEFIPIAETRGLIGPLGDIVLERALAAAADWGDLDLHVNLSAVQVDTVGYVERLLDRIIASGIPVERVAMEITESVLLSDSAPTVENLEMLTDSGVGLVLDDFGTGYASLTYLRRFPFRGIKVDRSFVAGMERSPDDSAIVSMVLALASSLGLQVIAEGVETSGQESLLRAMGCRFVQGFRYSTAVPSGDVPGLINRFASGDAGAR